MEHIVAMTSSNESCINIIFIAHSRTYFPSPYTLYLLPISIYICTCIMYIANFTPRATYRVCIYIFSLTKVLFSLRLSLCPIELLVKSQTTKPINLESHLLGFCKLEETPAEYILSRGLLLFKIIEFVLKIKIFYRFNTTFIALKNQ